MKRNLPMPGVLSIWKRRLVLTSVSCVWRMAWKLRRVRLLEFPVGAPVPPASLAILAEDHHTAEENLMPEYSDMAD